MRNIINLLLGSDLKKLAAHHAKYVHKYAETDVAEFSRTMSWITLDDGTTEIKRAERDTPCHDVFVSTTDDLYNSRLLDDSLLHAEDRSSQLRDFFTRIHHQTITINNSGDSNSLLIALFVPLYDEALCREATDIARATSEVDAHFSVVIVGFGSDLRGLLTGCEARGGVQAVRAMEEQAARALEEFAALREEASSLEHIVVLQNTNAAGFALDLSRDSLVRIMGEISLLMVEKYDTIFVQAAAFDREHPLCSLGIAVLHLDRYFFANFLLRKAYLHLLDREHVADDRVDINRVALISQNLLQDHRTLFSNFYNTHIAPRVRQGEKHEVILAETAQLLRDELDRVATDLTAFIGEVRAAQALDARSKAQGLTLPEKQALLALIMGYDDRLLSGNLFNRDLLSIDDLDQEVASIFIEENNEQVRTETTDDGRSYYVPGPIDVCMGPDGKVELPISELKQLRLSMRESTNYIRRKTGELHEIELMTQDADLSERRLTERGFVVDGVLYRFDVAHTEVQFDECYVAHTPSAASIDLRAGFTSIKDQGQIGACTVFAVASIFEYSIRQTTGLNSDLSESFVYYNVRVAKGQEREDTGSSFRDVIESMGEKGICTEALHPYAEGLTGVPSAEAYDDARGRRIVKALGVGVDEASIKSAIEDGHPVAVSLKVFNSFSSTTRSGRGSKVGASGFVKMPTESERASGEFGYHAMVVCGYSDETHHFVVRNSWGKGFGDKGYCYIPYAYICDPDLNRMACIITEFDVSGTNVVVEDEGRGTHTAVQFNMSDAAIKAAVIAGLIEEEKQHLGRLQQSDLKLRKAYETLMQKLGRQSLRNTLMERRRERIGKEIADLRSQQAHINEEVRPERLREFDRSTWKSRIALVVWDVVWAIAWMVGFFGDSSNMADGHDAHWIGSTPSLVITVLLGVGIVITMLYFSWIRTARRRIEMDLEEMSAGLAQRAAQLEADLYETPIKMHVAGMVVDELLSLKHSIDEKYQAMKSYVGNLAIWRAEEQQHLSAAEVLVKPPFIPLLSTETLEAYFDQQKEVITAGLHLCEYFNSYKLGDEAIIAYKRGLKERLLRHAESLLADFSIFRHIFGTQRYPFLDDQYASAANLLPLLDRKSEPFCSLRSSARTAPQARFLFLRTDAEERLAWQKEYPQYFASTTISEDIASPYKIVELRIQPLSVASLQLPPLGGGLESSKNALATPS